MNDNTISTHDNTISTISISRQMQVYCQYYNLKKN